MSCCWKKASTSPQQEPLGKDSPGEGNVCLLIQGKLLELIISLPQTQIQHLATSTHNKKGVSQAGPIYLPLPHRR